MTAQGIETPVPKDLPRDKYNEWMGKLLDIQKNMFGAENLVSADGHWDEEHEYIDSETGEKCTSRVHLHSVFVPVDERGQLNGKAFSSKKNMRALNRAVEEMTQRDYGVSFHTGAKGRSRESVRDLKDKSAAAVLDREEQVTAREHRAEEFDKANQDDFRRLQEQRHSLDRREDAVWCREAEAEYTAREERDYCAELTDELDRKAWKVGLWERKAKADMEAARVAQEAADQQAKEQRELISLGRRAKAERAAAPALEQQRRQATQRDLPFGGQYA